MLNKKVITLSLIVASIILLVGFVILHMHIRQSGSISYSPLPVDTLYLEDISEQQVLSQKNIELYHTVSFLDVEGNVDFSFKVAHGDSLGIIPESDWEEGILDYWSNNVTSERLRTNTPILEDAVYKPNYIYIEWLIINALDDAGLTLDDISVENFTSAIEYIKAMQNS